VYSQLDEDSFEYIVVDNLSQDNSLEILEDYARDHKNMKIISERCTIGKGRQIGFLESSGEYIMIIDTDTVFFPKFKEFVEIYFQDYPHHAVQAIYASIFPRKIWTEVGGRRDLNVYEDVDMWVRIWKLGKMRFYPVLIGENLKDSKTHGGWDFLSERYNKAEKFQRFVRKELDLIKAREAKKSDLERMLKENTIDLGLGEFERTWFKNPPRIGLAIWAIIRTQDLIKILKSKKK
jgi:glycosyltransferase involved in cell wall biosynthesis